MAYVEPFRTADGKTHYRARVLLADGTRPRRRVPDEKCAARSEDERRKKAEAWADWLQEQESKRGLFLKREQEKRARAGYVGTIGERIDRWLDERQRRVSRQSFIDSRTAVTMFLACIRHQTASEIAAHEFAMIERSIRKSPASRSLMNRYLCEVRRCLRETRVYGHSAMTGVQALEYAAASLGGVDALSEKAVKVFGVGPDSSGAEEQ